MSKRPSSSSPPGSGPSSPKRKPPTLHSWLHPEEPAPLLAHSPPLHAITSTFTSITLQFEPPTHITTIAALTRECQRRVRELDVPGLVGGEAMEKGEGAFADGEGRAPGRKGKERAREPDHRMWAVRCICLKEGKNGTGGEDDYQLLETFNDDGEKYGGERVLRILQEQKGVDVLTICCRWYGGDMLGPIRFQHIGLTAQHSLTALNKLVILTSLRQSLEDLDRDIASLRTAVNPPSSPLQSIDGPDDKQVKQDEFKGRYDPMEDVGKMERLIKAKQKTKKTLEDRVGWIGLEQAGAEAVASAAISADS